MDISNNIANVIDQNDSAPCIERYISNIIGDYSDNVGLFQQNINYDLRYGSGQFPGGSSPYCDIMVSYTQLIRYSIDILNTQMTNTNNRNTHTNNRNTIHTNNRNTIHTNNRNNTHTNNRNNTHANNHTIDRIRPIHREPRIQSNYYNDYTRNEIERNDRPTTIVGVFDNIVNQYRDGVSNFRTIMTDLEDVIVRPTQPQIEFATEEFVNYIDSSGQSMNICPITLEPFVNAEVLCRIKGCRHIFKREAIAHWFRRNVRCPVCRYDIRDYQEVVPVVSNIYSYLQEEIPTDVSNSLPVLEPRTVGSSSRNIMNNLSGMLQTFISNEINNGAFDSTISDLLYTFDIPIRFDVSMNLIGESSIDVD